MKALLAKYTRMRALRVRHARALCDPTYVEPDPRAEMASLARAFPGALRELDELPMELLERRVRELEQLVGEEESRAGEDERARSPLPAPSWVLAVWAYHRLARGALAAKRWLRGAAVLADAPEARGRLLEDVSRGVVHADAAAWCDELPALVRPAGGRLMPLVTARLARELDVDEETALAWVHPVARASTRSTRRPR